MHILCVDDNPINRQVAEKLVGSLGHTFESAENGEEALKSYEAGVFDLILMDLQMPVMDGLEATKQIRLLEKDGRRRTSIMAVTANAMLGDRQTCLESGMDHYIPKPLRRNDLLLAIQELSGASSSPISKETSDDIDWEQFDEVVEPDDTECIEIYHDYCQLCAEGINQIAQQSDESQAEQVATLAHQHKGSSLTFGLTALAAYLIEAEEKGIAADLPLGADWKQSAHSALQSAQETIEAKRGIKMAG